MKVQLKREGLGKIDHSPVLDVDELQQIYSSVAMNTETPVGLQNKVWFDVMFYLCRRGRENLRQMTKSTFQIAVGNKGLEYVYQYRDEMDKNHNEDDTEGNTTEGRMYAVLGNPLCPVTSFKKYLSKLHPSRDDLWQKPRDTYNEDSSTWYCNAPLGKNTLSNMMKNICKYAELPKEYNNHSIRATSISVLDSQFASRDIMKISGHKSETSIKSYSAKTTDKKKHDLSNFLLNSLQDCSTVLGENTGLAASIEEEIFLDQNQIDELLKPMENENSTHSEINDSDSELSVQILQPIENKKVNENNHSNKQISMQMISESNQEIRNNVVVHSLKTFLVPRSHHILQDVE